MKSTRDQKYRDASDSLASVRTYLETDNKELSIHICAILSLIGGSGDLGAIARVQVIP